jgi:hypothetical protein
MTNASPNYLFNANEKPSLEVYEIPIIAAKTIDLTPYGCLVDDPESFDIEIVVWPPSGWRPVDEDTGDQGGTVEGVFQCEWRGDVLEGRNDAVDGHYVLGWSRDPQSASETTQTAPRDRVLLWHMNYHPDGGQLFYPLDSRPFVVPVAPPGDDLKLDEMIAIYCDGSQGLYIHPGVWHEGVFPTQDQQKFGDRQGRVHARVSCDFADEFNCYVKAPLKL